MRNWISTHVVTQFCTAYAMGISMRVHASSSAHQHRVFEVRNTRTLAEASARMLHSAAAIRSPTPALFRPKNCEWQGVAMLVYTLAGLLVY
jgi:hypothetical protein